MQMDIKSLKSAVSNRLIELRQSLHFSTKKMAEYFMVSATTYHRYEQGKMLPGFTALYSAAKKLGISLDWLVCSKGPVYYKEIEKKDQVEEKKEIHKDLLTGSSGEEIKDLLEHMNRIPLLRHEVLVYFYKFKTEHKDMVVEGMAEQG
jgi:transcriptional regulator with XRE-family HTH domain